MILHVCVCSVIIVVLALVLDNCAQTVNITLTLQLNTTQDITAGGKTWTIQNTTQSVTKWTTHNTTGKVNGKYCLYRRCYYKKEYSRYGRQKTKKTCEAAYDLCKTDDDCCDKNSKKACCKFEKLSPVVIALIIISIVAFIAGAFALGFYGYKAIARKKQDRRGVIVSYPRENVQHNPMAYESSPMGYGAPPMGYGPPPMGYGPPPMGYYSTPGQAGPAPYPGGGPPSFQGYTGEGKVDPETAFPNQGSASPSPAEYPVAGHGSLGYATPPHPGYPVQSGQSPYPPQSPTSTSYHVQPPPPPPPAQLPTAPHAEPPPPGWTH